MWKDGSWLVCWSLAGFFLPQEAQTAALIPCGWSCAGPCAFTLGYRCNGRVSGHSSSAAAGNRLSRASLARDGPCLSGSDSPAWSRCLGQPLWLPAPSRGESAHGRSCGGFSRLAMRLASAQPRVGDSPRGGGDSDSAEDRDAALTTTCTRQHRLPSAHCGQSHSNLHK